MVVECMLAVSFALGADAAPDFSREVQPVLAAKCYPCHGPDAEQRKAGLRLDTKEGAFGQLRSGGQAVVSGDLEASELVRRIFTEDVDDQMPPAEFPKPLTDAERELLRRWVESGAAWSGHWSFEPIKHPSPPPVEDAAWPRNSVDNFVLAALEARGMSPAPEADRRTLIRRLSFDLTGLPPAPERVEDFVNDPAPDAYERLVDELLASPRHGERWARHWLDVAHYGETHGYDKDKRRAHAWPYRDYVIQSLNDDKPYGQFVREQLAGDVLYPDDPQATAATGFIAAGPWDFVGHVELREGTTDKAITRTLDRDDMVANAMSSFTSLTVHCARCHDHKFDPIRQHDYYALQAVFAGVDRANRPYGPDAATQRRRAELVLERDQWQARIDAYEGVMQSADSPELTRLEELEKELSAAIARTETKDSPTNGFHSAIEQEQDTAKWVQVDLGDTLPIDAVRLIPARPTDFTDTPGFGFPLRFKVEISDDAEFVNAATLADYSQADYPSPEDQSVEVAAAHATGRYVRVTATRLWQRLDDYVFALGELQVVVDGVNVAMGNEVRALDSIDSGRWHTRNLVDGYDSRQRLGDKAATEDEARSLNRLKLDLKRVSRDIRELRIALLPEADRQGYDEAKAALNAATASLDALPEPALVYAAASDYKPEGSFAPPGGPREIFVLARGDVKSPTDRAWPGTVGCMSDLPSDFGLREGYAEGEARAALAEWITREDNALTWRSIVNRVWQHHFGKGIVDTPNDFGLMGSPPTHPELLDWLAAEFLAQGQSLKGLHKLLVCSAAYRQRSTSDHDYAAIDGSNQYLWHMERQPLDAESLRDAVLSVSGKLDLTTGGPPFDTFAFEDDHSPRYLYAQLNPSDARAFRRSIYRTIVRSVPDPWMTALDCADPSQSVPVRNQTITALQALALFNNPFVTRQAVYFAERLEREAPDLDGQLKRAWQLTLSREPKADELGTIRDYANQHGLTAACRVIFNMNEFAYVD